MQIYDISLVLSCCGDIINGRVNCRSTSNVVLDLKDHSDNKALITFLDSCDLFNNKMISWNKIVNVIKLLNDKFNVLEPKVWEFLQLWIPSHKRCGAILQLVFNSDLETYTEKMLSIEEEVYIPEKIL